MAAEDWLPPYFDEYDFVDTEVEYIRIRYDRIVDATDKGILIEGEKGLAWFPKRWVTMYQDGTMTYPDFFDEPQWDNPADDFNDVE